MYATEYWNMGYDPDHDYLYGLVTYAIVYENDEGDGTAFELCAWMVPAPCYPELDALAIIAARLRG